MSADKFENEISALYQQRKQQTQAPEFDPIATTKPVKHQRSPWHMLVLLLTGGIASFGIMAVITHFATPAVHGTSEQYKQHSVRVVEVTEINIETPDILPVSPPLPPKPESLAANFTENSRVSQEHMAHTQAKPLLNQTLNHKVNVPAINQPSIAIVPIHRVMPEYPKSALYARTSGTVKLQYRISTEGKVVDISGSNKPGIRLLERSAKQALTQWRYPAESGSAQLLEVEFEFNLAQ